VAARWGWPREGAVIRTTREHYAGAPVGVQLDDNIQALDSATIDLGLSPSLAGERGRFNRAVEFATGTTPGEDHSRFETATALVTWSPFGRAGSAIDRIDASTWFRAVPGTAHAAAAKMLLTLPPKRANNSAAM